MRIFYAEDERDILESTTRHLKAEGHSVDTCRRGDEAMDYLEMTEYDAVILDIMLPGLDGLEILCRLRKAGSTVPVLLLTARDAIRDRVGGLDAGADDYLTKPFAFAELSARLRALFRRPQTDEPLSNIRRLADLSLDQATHEVRRGEISINLSAKEFAILEYMLRNQGQVLSREQIEQNAWSYDFIGGSNVVDVYIRYLRKKIDDGFSPKLIHTVRGAGYVLKEET